MTDHLSETTGAWDHGLLAANIRLGQGCYLENRASFRNFDSERRPGLVLGDRVRVYRWTDFNVEPSGRLLVGADSTLVGAVFMCAERIEIGARVAISYNVLIADCDMHPRDADLRRQDALGSAPYGGPVDRPPLEASPVTIEDDVTIGIGTIVLKGVRIGSMSRVAAGSVVVGDVPRGARVAGNPARELGEAGASSS